MYTCELVGQKCRKNAHNSKLESHNFADKGSVEKGDKFFEHPQKIKGNKAYIIRTKLLCLDLNS